MDNGFVGVLSQVQQGYRCYMLFLPNESTLNSPAEEYIMRYFWDVASFVGEEVLFTGLTRGNGLASARKNFGITETTESFILLLDIPPSDWKEERDPVVIIPLRALKTEYDVNELLHVLVEVTKKTNFIGKMKRKQTFEKVRQYLRHVPTVGKIVKYLIPS